MATVIKPKRSNTLSAIPTTSDLDDGELAVNTADNKIYMRVGGTVKIIANLTETVIPNGDFGLITDTIIEDQDDWGTLT
jgi:hypothetical protein